MVGLITDKRIRVTKILCACKHRILNQIKTETQRIARVLKSLEMELMEQEINLVF